MERRKLLLGSGAALVTVLAGCSGSETDDEEPDESDDTNESNDSNETEPDGNESDQNEVEEDERDDVPGFDAEAFSIESDLVSVDRIEYDDGESDETDGNESDDGDETDAPQGVVRVHGTAEVDDREELYGELDSLAADVDAAMVDIAEFKKAVATVELSFVDADGEELDTLSVDPLWVYQYIEDQLTDEQFLQQVLSTSERSGN